MRYIYDGILPFHFVHITKNTSPTSITSGRRSSVAIATAAVSRVDRAESLG